MSETKIAVIAIIVENADSVEKLNRILHENSRYIIGRMGLPYRQRNISLISIALDAPADAISELQNKIAELDGVTVSSAAEK